MHSIEERDAQIRELLKSGQFTRPELAEAFGLSMTTINHITRKISAPRTPGPKTLATPRFRSDVAKRNQQIRDAINSGEMDRQEVAEQTGLGYSTVCQIAAGCGNSKRGYGRSGSSVLEAVPYDELFSESASSLAERFDVQVQTVYAHRRTRKLRRLQEEEENQ